MATDFFGLDLLDVDQDTVQELVILPLGDAMRTMHSFTCPNHGFTINEDGTFTLMADEVRSIYFVIYHWYDVLSDVLPEDMPPELSDILDDMQPYANSNQDYSIRVSDAALLWPVINALDTMATLRFSYGAYLIVVGDDEDEDEGDVQP